MISGIQILKKVITDDRGKILHMLRNDDKTNFKKIWRNLFFIGFFQKNQSVCTYIIE